MRLYREIGQGERRRWCSTNSGTFLLVDTVGFLSTDSKVYKRPKDHKTHETNGQNPSTFLYRFNISSGNLSKTDPD